jgi:hypothetical protein
MATTISMTTENAKWSHEEALTAGKVDAELRLILAHADRIQGGGEPENPDTLAVPTCHSAQELR